jgi:uncharacterized Zn-finger protein
MAEERRISPAVIIGIGAGIGIASAVALYAIARAAAPPKPYACPYCPDTFSTYEDLVDHVQSVHPGERIPIDIIWE